MFKKLTSLDLKEICRLILEELKEALLKRKNITFIYDDKVILAPLENGEYERET